MAQFRIEGQGNRNVTSRLGSKVSGIWSHTRGWDAGVMVDGQHEGGRDVFYVYATEGSNGRTPRRLICTITDTPGESPDVQLAETD